MTNYLSNTIFEPTLPGQLLIVEHQKCTNQDRASRAMFTDDGMRPGLSVSFNPTGQLSGATNDFGTRAGPEGK